MKFAGTIAFATYSVDENEPGIYEESYVLRHYRGDVERRMFREHNSSSINNELTVNVQISFVADRYAIEHAGDIRYVEYLGTKWMVESIDIRPPRLVLNLGPRYHENTTGGS